MPRKVRVPAPRDENRQSQQRSRQRHREYVASLVMRLSQYEQRDAQATIEMQRAARAVALRNQRLLALLTIHGVGQDEIDAFLRDDGDGAPLRAEDDHAAERPPQQPKVSSADMSHHHAYPSQPISCHATASANGTSPQGVLPSSNIPDPTSDDAQHHDDHVVRSESMIGMPATNACSRQAAADVMSCDDAAAIIASLQNHGDRTGARAKLGCTGPAACSVKNIDLFELIDQVS